MKHKKEWISKVNLFDKATVEGRGCCFMNQDEEIDYDKLLEDVWNKANIKKDELEDLYNKIEDYNYKKGYTKGFVGGMFMVFTWISNNETKYKDKFKHYNDEGVEGIMSDIKINGTIMSDNNISVDEFVDLFIAWIEQNNMKFLGCVENVKA